MAASSGFCFGLGLCAWLFAATYGFVVPQQQQPMPYQQPIRNNFYPVRTNCPTNMCNQNRYRWNLRPNPVPAPAPQIQNNCLKCRGNNNNGQPNRNILPNGNVVPGIPGVQIFTPNGPHPNIRIVTHTYIPSTTPSITLPVTESPVGTTTPEQVTSTSPTSEPSTVVLTTTSALASTSTSILTSTEAVTSTPSSPEVSSTLIRSKEIGERTANNGSTSTLPTPPPYTELQGDTTTPQTRTTPQLNESTTTFFLRPGRRKGEPDYLNPCPYGQPLMNSFDTPVSCNHVVLPNGGCPEEYWCHTGTTYATTTCCPTNNWGKRCNLIRHSGEGRDLVPRWYYDVATKQCKRFLYKGTRGNANNFVSQVACAEACEHEKPVVDHENPCRHGKPLRDPSGKKVPCGFSGGNQCPSDHYCHVGDTAAATACCQKSGIEDYCTLPVNVGHGRASLKRFYYNSVARRCIEFVYKGAKGNENNYLSYNECKRVCMKWSNPCPPLFDYGPHKECSVTSNTCDKGEWCHIGSTKDTTACCPGAVTTPCQLPVEVGVGNESLTRWYADPNDKSCNKQCKSFIYKGAKGNQNNFISRDACEATCKSECVNPCSNVEMLLDPAGVPRTCSPVSPCPTTHWCHVGDTVETTVCCATVPNPCTLPKISGTGGMKSTRYFFDVSAKRCASFIYRGQGGNQNNFLTIQDCQETCPSYSNPCGGGHPLLNKGGQPKVCNPNERCPGTHFCHIGTEDADNVCCPKNGDPCGHKPASGIGNSRLSRFYYDKETRRCREFTYHGAKGNANNFLSVEDCEAVCPVFPNPCQHGEPLLSKKNEPIICGGSDTCPSGYFCHVGSAPETTNCCPGTRRPCDLIVDRGHGSESLERWHFDGSTQTCRKFKYSGMKGNANNFLSREMCQEQCHEMNPCLFGDPLLDESTGERQQCADDESVCPRTHYCHVGAGRLTTICCPKSGILAKSSSQEISDPCDQPLNQGVGPDQLPRWYFDVGANKCKRFVYTGTKGNENNFVNRQSCEEKCPEYRSYCPHGLPLVDTKAARPVPCGINHGCPAGFLCHMSAEFSVSICCEDPADFCLQPRDPGPCHGNETRYGYHPLSDTCVPYNYGGCDGTLNNFKSLERCTEICCKDYLTPTGKVDSNALPQSYIQQNPFPKVVPTTVGGATAAGTDNQAQEQIIIPYGK